MAIQVGLSGTTVKTVAAVGSTTQVKKVVVGTPIRRVRGSASAADISNISGISTTGAVLGSILMYNPDDNLWSPSRLLENHEINGGSY